MNQDLGSGPLSKITKKAQYSPVSWALSTASACKRLINIYWIEFQDCSSHDTISHFWTSLTHFCALIWYQLSDIEEYHSFIQFPIYFRNIFSHLILWTNLWNKDCHSHFADEKTESWVSDMIWIINGNNGYSHSYDVIANPVLFIMLLSTVVLLMYISLIR